MNPFELFESPEIYKMALLYFSGSRGLAIVARNMSRDNVEVIRLAGEVDPSTGKFIALDYSGQEGEKDPPVITKEAFEHLVSFIEAKVGDQIRMSVIEPQVLKSVSSVSPHPETGRYVH
jgi:hypothetical protein